MKRFIPVIIFAAIQFPVIPVTSATNDIWKGGSNYAHFGLGLPHDFQASYSDGMGLYGVALHDNRSPSIANPASWSRSIFTTAGGAFEINSLHISGGGNQINSTQFQTGPFQLVFPIHRDRIGISLSISPLTAARYTMENEGILEPDQNHSGEEMRYITENVGSGGINKIEAGIGYRLTNSISIGYAPSLLLGVINRKQTLNFDNTDYRAVNLRETTSHYGFGNRFGIYFSRGGVLRNSDQAVFGATVSLPVKFVSERRLESKIANRDVSINPPSYYGKGQTTFPLEASGGFSYHINSYLLVGADAIYQKWKGYTNFNGQAESFLKDRIRLGVGSQYIAALGDGTSFFSRFIYRMGVSYDTGNFTFENTDIETIMIHGGIGIPSSETNSSIDINAEFGFRGTEFAGLVSERIFALKVSFNLSELMFIQRRLQ
ncbi:MAG: hypothetical protein WD097_04195 [Balneolales bacterium]